MKNYIILASLVAAFVVITGCTNTCHSPCATSSAPVSHHDLKGEVEK